MFTLSIILIAITSTLLVSSFAVTLLPTGKKKKQLRVAVDPIDVALKELQSEYDKEIVDEIRKDIFQNRR